MKKRSNQVRGKRAQAYGAQFERLIEISCRQYANQGVAYINKTYPPFTTLRRQGKNVIGFYGQKGQPDFAGTLKNGRSVVFESKHTSTTNIQFKQVAPHQKQSLKRHCDLGAESFILIAFKLDNIYKVSIKDWIELEKTVDKKSLNETDLAEYKLNKDKGLINFLEEMN